MGEYKVSSEKQNSKAAPIQAPIQSSLGEMKHEDARGSTFQLAQLQAKADDRGSKSNITQLQAKALNFSRNSQLAQLQDKGADQISSSQSPTVQRQENKTGLPDGLKSGMESLSGMSLSDVKVHRNSDKPAQLQAHAYAQGTDIHLGPGQEKHLPHELGHVVQQKEGRVKPTTQLKSATPINDDKSLEQEADVMGAKALHLGGQEMAPLQAMRKKESTNDSSGIVQRKETIAPLEGEVKGMGTFLKNKLGGGTIYTNLKKKVDEFNAADEVLQLTLRNDIVMLSDEWRKKHPNPESENDKKKSKDISKLINQLTTRAHSKTADTNKVADADKVADRTVGLGDPLQHPLFPTFKKRLESLFAEFPNPSFDVDTQAAVIWTNMVNAVKDTREASDKTKNPDLYKDNGYEIKDLDGALFKPILDAFDTVVSQLKPASKSQFARAKSFGFWSKAGIHMAKKHADLALETSGLGSLFDGFPSMVTTRASDWDFRIWPALSKGYAQCVVDEIIKGGKTVEVFTGGPYAEGNIWEKIESKALAVGLENTATAMEDVTTYHAVANTKQSDKSPIDENQKGGRFPGTWISTKDRGLMLKTLNEQWDLLPKP